METIIEKEVNVRIFDTTFLQTKKNRRSNKMSKTAAKIVRKGTMISFLIIIALALIFVFSKNLLILKALIIIGSIFLLASLGVLVLKYTGFYEILHLSNPPGLQATDVAIAFGVVGIFSITIPAIYGVLLAPALISRLQIFISNQQESTTKALEILEGLEKLFLTSP